MPELKSLWEEADAIFARLGELEKMDFPQYRSYRRPDGAWVDREPVSEYLEQKELIRRWYEINAFENSFHKYHNPLLISTRLYALRNSLREEPEPMDNVLLWRIAESVYRNAPVCCS